MYQTSYDVQVSGTFKSFTVSNSVAQPNKFQGISVQEKPVYEESDLGLPEIYE
ncbi:hypothetical protein [Candidatus Pristimantibacillus sp. PTI5]|uniref:hypothetical protein n=1 Tax=Candidatus Pristimantibacillus sp. PTI5 TaxID=3400422 RepID=UPI003B01E070